MKPVRTNRYPIRSKLALEILEDRTVPATIIISDASGIEGSSTYRYTDTFVTPDAYGLAAGREVEVGLDGKVYIASHDSDAVLIFNGESGHLIGELTTSGGELDGPWGMVFGPDGSLYVNGRWSHNVVRFDVVSGTYNVFLTEGETFGNGIAFGPDGNFYAGLTTGQVNRYDGGTGAYIDDFVGQGSGGLSNPARVAFGPDGNLFVIDESSRNIKRYNGQTGAFIDTFVSAGSGGLDLPRDMRFTDDGCFCVPDTMGYVYRFSSATGAYIDRLVTGPEGNTNAATALAISPSGEWYVSRGTPTGVSGSFVTRLAPMSLVAFNISVDSPSAAPISVDFSTSNGSAIEITDYFQKSGTITFATGQTTQTIFVQTVNDGTVESPETFFVNLSNPIGATIADGQGIGTITDDDATKFFVVDDAATNQTFRYGAPGNGLGSSNLTTGNSAPRGATSTAAGDKVWVVDANKTVYVYNPSGTLLGSWAAGGISGQPQIEGIATNGTDVWLVDAKSDKVYRYAGAASRLSGSQNAASSFSLNSGNKNSKGLVTDGTSMWVVDDSTTNKVFKYNLSGSLQGSWTIDAANASPTGLTINPANVSDIWIVDNGTDRVYQYAAAVGRTSGSQSAVATFALAPGNTNPQDIADPPTAEMLLTPETILDRVGNTRSQSVSIGTHTINNNFLRNSYAASWGWFLDKTPESNSPLPSPILTKMRADAGSKMLTILQQDRVHLPAGVAVDALFAGGRRSPASVMKGASLGGVDLVSLLGERQYKQNRLHW